MCAVINHSYAAASTGKFQKKLSPLWKRTSKVVGILLTSDSMGSCRINSTQLRLVLFQ